MHFSSTLFCIRDAYALDVLGSSLFMQDDGVGALRAWNQIGKPRVNRVRIEGLHRTRYQTVAEVMARARARHGGIQPGVAAKTIREMRGPIPP